MSRRRKSYSPCVVMCHDKNCLILHEWHQGASSEMSWSEIYEHLNQVSSNLSFTVWFSDVVLQCPIIQMQIKLTNCLSVFFPQTPESHTLGEDTCLSLKNHKQRFVSFFFVRSQMLVGNRTIGNLAVWACSIKYDTSELGRSKRHVECLPNLDCLLSWQWNAKKI